nr:hypothetical protein [Tanacetum cinerariifolium]
MENPEKAFVNYASSRTDEAGAHAPMYNAILDKYVESLKLGKKWVRVHPRRIPERMKDPILLTLPCRLGDSQPFDTLADLGSCVNLIPLYLLKKLEIGLLEGTDHIFGLVDRTKSYPIGIVKNVEVHIERLKLLDEFYIIDIEKTIQPFTGRKGILSDRQCFLAPSQSALFPYFTLLLLSIIPRTSTISRGSVPRPNGDALRKCIFNGPYIPTTIVVQAVAATDDSPAVPEHTTPEWSRFVTIFKQQHKLDEVSYHKLFDILKQYQKEVNELHAKRLARNANPLALIATAQANQDSYYQTSMSQKSYAASSKPLFPTRSHTTTRYKGKEIAKPITPPSESSSKEDSNPKQAQRDKDMQNNLALIAKYFKRIYKPTNNNLKTFQTQETRTWILLYYTRMTINLDSLGIRGR